VNIEFWTKQKTVEMRGKSTKIRRIRKPVASSV